MNESQKLTDAAMEQLVRTFIDGMQSLANGDSSGRDACTAKAATILNNPRSAT
ncbi:hypothetical protein AB0F88_40340 [Streptosporangium sp. NPDC023963]|uniref:hypothetical protein n=1 Tax=Streptosporangium sp. NPDC023963 TaxID=3155608 RepID=UPI00341C596F